ncbi:MAG: exodeoxyribonuclease VII large subunit, partial [Puniceicoccales bacterium]
LRQRKLEFAEIRKQLRRAVDRRLQEKKQKVEHLIPALRSGGLDQTLRRGFALIRDPDGNFRKKAGDWEVGDTLSIQFQDGTVEARAEKVLRSTKSTSAD